MKSINSNTQSIQAAINREELIVIDPKTTIAFAGHSSDKITESGKDSHITYNIQIQLIKLIWKLYKKGYRTFVSSMAQSFDLMAADTILRLQPQLTEIRFVAIISHPQQASEYPSRHLQTYNDCTNHANHTITLSEHYDQECQQKRDDFLLKNCSKLVYYHDRQSHKADQMITKAQNMGLEVINIYDMM